jgi:hypothetical protein
MNKILFGDDKPDRDLTRSLQQFGILSPVKLFSDSTDNIHLIDGFRRARFALETGLSSVEAIVLPASTGIEEMISMILYNKRSMIEESAMNKVCFISYAVSQKTSEEWILSNLCKILELKPHSSTLKECERIGAMPGELKRFCHDKKFSLKQILNLTHHPEDLLMQLMEWRDVLQLTASVLDEVASNLRDYLKSNNIDMETFVNDRQVIGIIDSGLSPRDRTDSLRKLISSRRYPVLSEINERIERAIRRMDLPDGVVVSWDRTLENKEVRIDILIKDTAEWKRVICSLHTEEIKGTIGEILSEL